LHENEILPDAAVTSAKIDLQSRLILVDSEVKNQWKCDRL